MELCPCHRVHLECYRGDDSSQSKTSRNCQQSLLVSHFLKLSGAVHELHLQDEVGEGLSGEAGPVADHGVAAAVCDHDGDYVSWHRPARLVAPVEHLEVGDGAADLHRGVLAALQLTDHLDVTQLRSPVSQRLLQSI